MLLTSGCLATAIFHSDKPKMYEKTAYACILDHQQQYLLPLNQTQGIEWCHWFVARTSSCLATAIFHSNQPKMYKNKQMPTS